MAAAYVDGGLLSNPMLTTVTYCLRTCSTCAHTFWFFELVGKFTDLAQMGSGLNGPKNPTQRQRGAQCRCLTSAFAFGTVLDKPFQKFPLFLSLSLRRRASDCSRHGFSKRYRWKPLLIFVQIFPCHLLNLFLSRRRKRSLGGDHVARRRTTAYHSNSCGLWKKTKNSRGSER